MVLYTDMAQHFELLDKWHAQLAKEPVRCGGMPTCGVLAAVLCVRGSGGLVFLGWVLRCVRVSWRVWLCSLAG